MQLQSALVSGLLVALQCLHVSAGSLDGAEILGRRSLDVEEQLRRHARNVVDYVEKRQTGSTPTASGNPSDPSSIAKWEADTEVRCEQALTGLNGQASNPTGMAVCYNLPFLDNSTGVFEAEVRLYNVSRAIDPWVGVKLADIQMTLSYTGATVQMMNNTVKRDTILSYPADGQLVERRAASPAQPSATGVYLPKPSNELKVLMYVGKINANMLGTGMTSAQTQQLLVPTIELSANSPSTQKPVKAVLSSTEASFVNGVFAKAVAAPSNTALAANADLPAPFKVPGISLGVPPIGLVVTLAWAVLFSAAVGLGTIGRIQFRDQYRRRVKNAAATRINTF